MPAFFSLELRNAFFGHTCPGPSVVTDHPFNLTRSVYHGCTYKAPWHSPNRRSPHLTMLGPTEFLWLSSSEYRWAMILSKKDYLFIILTRLQLCINSSNKACAKSFFPYKIMFIDVCHFECTCHCNCSLSTLTLMRRRMCACPFIYYSLIIIDRESHNDYGQLQLEPNLASAVYCSSIARFLILFSVDRLIGSASCVENATELELFSPNNDASR